MAEKTDLTSPTIRTKYWEWSRYYVYCSGCNTSVPVLPQYSDENLCGCGEE